MSHPMGRSGIRPNDAGTGIMGAAGPSTAEVGRSSGTICYSVDDRRIQCFEVGIDGIVHSSNELERGDDAQRGFRALVPSAEHAPGLRSGAAVRPDTDCGCLCERVDGGMEFSRRRSDRDLLQHGFRGPMKWHPRRAERHRGRGDRDVSMIPPTSVPPNEGMKLASLSAARAEGSAASCATAGRGAPARSSCRCRTGSGEQS
jgi:hypothetical protein